MITSMDESPTIAVSPASDRVFLHQGPRPQRIGLLGLETVAAITFTKNGPRPKASTICREGTLACWTAPPSCAVGAGLQRAQRLVHAVVHIGVVQLVLAVVGQKKFQRLLHEASSCWDRPEPAGPAWERRRPRKKRSLFRQFRPPEVPQHGVDGVHQIEARIDQRAIEIKDDELDVPGIELSVKADHPVPV